MPKRIGAERGALHALSDGALIQAMREGAPEAWAEFDARFRPLLETYAHRTGIARSEWRTLVMEVLEDAALRLATPAVEVPSSLSGYLVRAVHFRRLKFERAAARRSKHYAQATAAAGRGSEHEGVIRALCSEAALRDSEGSFASEESHVAPGIARLCALLEESLNEAERQILGWVAEDVPRRDIAAWLGENYEAVRKRITRLCARLRAGAPGALARLTNDEREDVARLLGGLGIDSLGLQIDAPSGNTRPATEKSEQRLAKEDE
ncbi:MAG TPA: hypothetical protein VJU87_06775 [Gemmatimonadaceae bacterium]|nr:hypothetical protein [Gemmatimonadaceae bacterium]